MGITVTVIDPADIAGLEGAVNKYQVSPLNQKALALGVDLVVAEASLKRVPLRFTLEHLLVMPHLSQETLQSSLLNSLRNEPYPPSFSSPPAPSRSANSLSHANKADTSPAIGNNNTTQTSHSGAPSYFPRDSTTFTRSDENVVSSNVSGVDDKKLPTQQAMRRTLLPSLNPTPNTSRSANSVSHGNMGDYSSPAVGNKNIFVDGYYRGAHAEIDCSDKSTKV
ncbi:unnamed protein product [Eruca vesicaria subsp. sativa]|uniref:Uncharacterized protein n=1 Tax=Eruca vesicaria subsp. sativa TaxID=29727 RepID=A0ABC8IW88_ERUVS|nr:unnamed protein product [Eruca vesicaria subsp. sativa]